MLSPDTMEAIEAHKRRAYIIASLHADSKEMAARGLGWEDIWATLKWSRGMTGEIAREAVFGRGK